MRSFSLGLTVSTGSGGAGDTDRGKDYQNGENQTCFFSCVEDGLTAASEAHSSWFVMDEEGFCPD